MSTTYRQTWDIQLIGLEAFLINPERMAALSIYQHTALVSATSRNVCIDSVSPSSLKPSSRFYQNNLKIQSFPSSQHTLFSNYAPRRAVVSAVAANRYVLIFLLFCFVLFFLTRFEPSDSGKKGEWDIICLEVIGCWTHCCVYVFWQKCAGGSSTCSWFYFRTTCNIWWNHKVRRIRLLYKFWWKLLEKPNP